MEIEEGYKAVMVPCTHFSRFEFPKTTEAAGKFGRQKVEVRQFRIELKGGVRNCEFASCYGSERARGRRRVQVRYQL